MFTICSRHRPSRRSPGRRPEGPGQSSVKPESAGFGPVTGKTRGFLADTTLGGRMGGGVHSPSLMLGTLTGLSSGPIATGVFPNFPGPETPYAIAGMGAVAAAVLGAPNSATLIVFELTGDLHTAIAVMVSVSLFTALMSHLVDRSYLSYAIGTQWHPSRDRPADLSSIGCSGRPAGAADGGYGTGERGGLPLAYGTRYLHQGHGDA